MSSYVSAYLYEISNIEKQIKLNNESNKKLRELRKNSLIKLKDVMEMHNLTEVDGWSMEKIDKIVLPKTKKTRKTKKVKEEEALKLFRKVGIPDPHSFYESYKSTQK